MTIDHHQKLARVVNELDAEPVTWPTAQSRIYLSDIEVLCATLEAEASIDLTEVTDRIQVLGDAIRLGSSTDVRQKYLTGDLWDLDPADLTARVENAARDLAVQQALTFTVSDDFETALVREASAALTAHADDVVTALREEYEQHAAAIKAASDAGITGITDTSDLLENGTPAQIKAYRAVAPAVVGLNRIANLRAKLTEVLRYGPSSPPVAAFVTGITDTAAMQGAWNRWVGETETVQHNLPVMGSHLATVKRKRIGGAWLALVNGGYQLRLNTAAETQAVIDTAHKAA